LACCVRAYRVMNRDSRSGKSWSDRPNPKWHRVTYWAGVLCALIAVLIVFRVIKSANRQPARRTRVVDTVASLARGSATTLELPQRRIYPYSVIPGGVGDPQELRNAIAHDPQVAQLYANFDLSHARIERLTSDREAYVAYRYDNRIYWTKKRLLLHAGETVITDGNETGRTRCGNRISEMPMQPVRQDEPPNAAANAPVVGIASSSSLVPALPVESPYLDPRVNGLALLPQASAPASPNPPPFFPLAGGGPSSFPSVTPPPPVPTPEPGALPLLALGFVALGLMEGLRIRNTRKD
jgi:hypothetical protein